MYANQAKSKQTKYVKSKLKKIRLIAMDVDGVLNDGKIIYGLNGDDYRIFNVQDGYGIKMALENGIKVVFISGKRSPVVSRRAKDLGITDIYQNVKNKGDVLLRILKRYRISGDETCVIGDDKVDISMLEVSGFPVAVANAVNEVKKAARYVTCRLGGDGAVREVIDLILSSQSI